MSSFLIVSLVKGGEVAAKQFSNSPNGLCKALPISERKKKIRKVLQGPQNTKEQIKQDDICLFLLQNMQLHDHMNIEQHAACDLQAGYTGVLYIIKGP